MLASQNGHSETVTALAKAGADLDIAEEVFHLSCFNDACSYVVPATS